MSEKCKELFPHEDTVNLNKFFGDPTGRNGQVDSKWFKENVVKWIPPYQMYYTDGKHTPFAVTVQRLNNELKVISTKNFNGIDCGLQMLKSIKSAKYL